MNPVNHVDSDCIWTRQGWAVKTGRGAGPRVLWERNSRREPRGGQALGSRPSWVRRLLPGTHPEPTLAPLLAGGTSCREREQGAPRTGSCAFSCVEPCGHSAQRPEPCPAVCAGSQTHQTSPLCTHTPLHRVCTDLLKDGKQLTTWGLWMHTGTDHRHLRNPLFPLPALSWGATTTAPPVTPCSATRPRPEGKAPSPTGGEGVWSCPERAPRAGQAWAGLLAATLCHLRRPPGKRPEASGLRVEPLSTASEKPLQYAGTSKNYIKLL